MNTTPPIRTAIVGLGYRGRYLLQLLTQIPDYEVVAVVDPVAPSRDEYRHLVHYTPESYETMLEECALSLVVVASPWSVQIHQAELAIRWGIDVALEVKGGLYRGEYDTLQSLCRRLGRRVFPLENTVFMYETMAMERLVASGLLGEIVHLRGGYRHDLRHLLAPGLGADEPHASGSWRSQYYLELNADLYPTHGLAPLCRIAGIGPHGDPACYLTAVASRAVGLRDYLSESKALCRAMDVRTGDIITTQLETAGGVLISLTHDTTLPRPKSLDYEVQGTRGLWQGEHRRIYIEGLCPEGTWTDDSEYLHSHQAPIWAELGEVARRADAHHAGMDYIMLSVLARASRGVATYPITLDDFAFWCSVTPLSARSIQERRAVEL